MLVLTSKVGEAVMIGANGEIQVVVMGIKGNQVRIGYNAPKEVPVHREKIFQLIKMEKEHSNGNGQTSW